MLQQVRLANLRDDSFKQERGLAPKGQCGHAFPPEGLSASPYHFQRMEDGLGEDPCSGSSDDGIPERQSRIVLRSRADEEACEGQQGEHHGCRGMGMLEERLKIRSSISTYRYQRDM